MKQYLDLLTYVLHNGKVREDRTNTGTLSVFGQQLSFNLGDGFPAVTTKKLQFNSVAAELAGFLEGTQSAARMRELGTTIWDANANASKWQENPNCCGLDDMGPIYGAQWRNWGNRIDQLSEIVQRLQENPVDRRLVVSAWNPGELDSMCLPPCHIMFQFYVREKMFLDCVYYIRSVDMFLGCPFDIASYALLTHIVAQQVDLAPGHLTQFSGDTHIYLNHVTAVKEQLSRSPGHLPTLNLWDGATIDNFTPDMARLDNYEHAAAIAAKMAV